MDKGNTKNIVRVFSTTYCPYCFSLKEYLKEKQISYEDIDVSVNKEALDEMVSRSGQMGVPVIEINGKIVVGFDRAAINGLLGI